MKHGWHEVKRHSNCGDLAWVGIVVSELSRRNVIRIGVKDVQGRIDPKQRLEIPSRFFQNNMKRMGQSQNRGLPVIFLHLDRDFRDVRGPGQISFAQFKV